MSAIAEVSRNYRLMQIGTKARVIGADRAQSVLEARADFNRQDVATIRRNDRVRSAVTNAGSLGTAASSAQRNDGLGF